MSAAAEVRPAPPPPTPTSHAELLAHIDALKRRALRLKHLAQVRA